MRAEEPAPPRAWRAGAVHVAARLGWASTTEATWGLAGLGAGIFALDGLEFGVDADVWFGTPPLLVVTPGIRYVFFFVPDVHPYVGPLYRRYQPLDGFGGGSDAVGARAGVHFPLTDRLYVGGGVLYEHLLDQNLFTVADAVYPELMLGVAF